MKGLWANLKNRFDYMFLKITEQKVGILDNPQMYKMEWEIESKFCCQGREKLNWTQGSQRGGGGGSATRINTFSVFFGTNNRSFTHTYTYTYTYTYTHTHTHTHTHIHTYTYRWWERERMRTYVQSENILIQIQRVEKKFHSSKLSL